MRMQMPPPGENSAMKKEAGPIKTRNLSVGFGTNEGTNVITSGGLEVIKDADDPIDEIASPAIADLKTLRASPIFEQMMNS